MEKPNVQVLARVPWDLFCSFTFVRENMPEGLRRKYFFELLRSLSGNVAVHFKRLLWMLRPEFGEATGRRHYHALIGGIPKHVLTERLCLVLMSQWEHQKPLVLRKAPDGKFRMLAAFCGSARIRIYESGMDGLDYVLPSEEEVAAVLRARGANAYEAKKFGGVQEVEFSESLIRFIRVRWLEQAANAQRRVTRSADAVQCRQRVVSDSALCASLGGLSSPALPFAPQLELPAVNQSSANASSLPQRESVLTEDRKSDWRDKGGGLFEIAYSVGL